MIYVLFFYGAWIGFAYVLSGVAFEEIGPGYLGLASLPLLGMAIGNGTEAAEFEKISRAFGIPGNGDGAGTQVKREPRSLGAYLMLIPCGVLEFVAALVHGAIYFEIVQFGKKMFPARIPVIGEVVKAVYPQISVQGIVVLLMTTLVVIAPVLFFMLVIRLGVWDRGYTAVANLPMARVKLGVPLGLYLSSMGMEGYMLKARFDMEGKGTIFVDPNAVALDPVAMTVIACLTFGLTTLVGFWTASKIEKFRSL